MGKVYTDRDRPPFKVNEKKDDAIYVRGVGKYDYKTLKKNVERKLQDLVKRNKKGAHYGIGKNSFNLLSDMWEALNEYEENH